MHWCNNLYMKRKYERKYIHEMTAPFYEAENCDKHVKTEQYL